MCNLYSVTTNTEAVRQLFRVAHNHCVQFAPLPAIFPGHGAPVVRPAADGEREVVSMSWGFVLPQPGKAPRRVTNVRDDKARSSSFWINSFKSRRCLVPASSFCEPDGKSPSGWHWFALAGEEPRPLFAFAGIWQRWLGPIKKDGPAVEIDTYAFMTTTPNALVSTINHERSPVLLASEAEHETWLRGTPDEAFALVHEFPPERMRIVQSGFTKLDLLGATS